jgi:hypothetical protein
MSSSHSATFSPVLGFSPRRLATLCIGAMLAGGLAAATIEVNTTADTLAGMTTTSVAAFNASATRSLRGAIIAVNNDAAGPHTINLPAGTYTLALANAAATTEENAAATGDLDILKTVTISGAGSATTVIAAGTSTANGIDKILSVNPVAANTGFAVSLSGVTLRHGRNPITAIVPGNNAGGAMDFDAGSTGSGTLTLTEVVFDQNATTNGDGGALALFNGGTITAINCSFTGNTATSSSAFGALGGAIFVGTTTNALSLSFSKCLLSANSTAIGTNGVAGSGGAVYSFKAAPTSFTITNSRIVGNVAAVGAPALDASTITGATIDAANNWFGANAPSSSLFTGAVTYSPNLVLTLSATPTTVVAGQTTAAVVAGITTNSSGASGFSVPDSTPVAFTATLGTISPASGTLMAGTKSATYTPTASSGAGSALATVDGQTVSATINIVSPFRNWQVTNFSADADNAAIAGEAADPDNDGLSNLIEYALGLNPNAFTATSLVVDTTTGALRLTAPKNPAATDITYLVEVSGDLVAWTSTGTTVVTNTATLLQVLDNTALSGAPRRFIRLKITKP